MKQLKDDGTRNQVMALYERVSHFIQRDIGLSLLYVNIKNYFFNDSDSGNIGKKG